MTGSYPQLHLSWTESLGTKFKSKTEKEFNRWDVY